MTPLDTVKKGLAKQKRADLLLIGALVLSAALLALWRYHTMDRGALAVVYTDGERTAAYPLTEDVAVRLTTGEGTGWNLLVIRDGAADVTDADCPDRLCVRMPPIRYAGENILCLPHRLEVRVEGDTPEEVDARLP